MYKIYISPYPIYIKHVYFSKKCFCHDTWHFTGGEGELTPVLKSQMEGIIYMPLGASFFEDVLLVEFMHLIFTCMPGELP